MQVALRDLRAGGEGEGVGSLPCSPLPSARAFGWGWVSGTMQGKVAALSPGGAGNNPRPRTTKPALQTKSLAEQKPGLPTRNSGSGLLGPSAQGEANVFHRLSVELRLRPRVVRSVPSARVVRSGSAGGRARGGGKSR